jgi:hypothetical protein
MNARHLGIARCVSHLSPAHGPTLECSASPLAEFGKLHFCRLLLLLHTMHEHQHFDIYLIK